MVYSYFKLSLIQRGVWEKYKDHTAKNYYHWYDFKCDIDNFDQFYIIQLTKHIRQTLGKEPYDDYELASRFYSSNVAFTFMNSPEGFTYWSEIFALILHNFIRKYRELRKKWLENSQKIHASYKKSDSYKCHEQLLVTY